ncbi:hypothetical protein [Salinispora arenicola]|uniref:hypothetical protein n=1 Tax=Salinispora arenicola TaxID=168697 RepID=UPI00039D6E4B|nr:hypothetical protein [Salinispora arenicola]NIL59719.1 hypothetical protein [Salinispora arenicola]NIL64342.1 hypothetical protein [Salinispora arenicola]
MGEDSAAPMDVVERLTTRRQGLFRKVVTGDTVSLGDRDAVVRWLRELHQERNQTVIIHRPWGSVCVVGEGKAPTDILMSEGDRMWYAARAGSNLPQKHPQLAPDEVEHVMLDALTSDTPPRWPEWREF